MGIWTHTHTLTHTLTQAARNSVVLVSCQLDVRREVWCVTVWFGHETPWVPGHAR